MNLTQIRCTPCYVPQEWPFPKETGTGCARKVMIYWPMQGRGQFGPHFRKN
jgi:hypothetical protein